MDGWMDWILNYGLASQIDRQTGYFMIWSTDGRTDGPFLSNISGYLSKKKKKKNSEWETIAGYQLTLNARDNRKNITCTSKY